MRKDRRMRLEARAGSGQEKMLRETQYRGERGGGGRTLAGLKREKLVGGEGGKGPKVP